VTPREKALAQLEAAARNLARTWTSITEARRKIRKCEGADWPCDSLHDDDKELCQPCRESLPQLRELARLRREN